MVNVENWLKITVRTFLLSNVIFLLYLMISFQNLCTSQAAFLLSIFDISDELCHHLVICTIFYKKRLDYSCGEVMLM